MKIVESGRNQEYPQTAIDTKWLVESLFAMNGVDVRVCMQVETRSV